MANRTLGDQALMSDSISGDRSPTEDAPRDCGGCNVCCTAMHVAPLGKPAGSPCAHQSEAGCGIYHDRPPACRVWFCMWVRDPGRIFTDRHRPDRLGVFFTASVPDPRTGQQTIYAHEVRAHAAGGTEVQRVLAFLSQAAPVEVVRFRPPPQQQPTPVALTREGREVAA